MKYLKIGIWILILLIPIFLLIVIPRVIVVKKITCNNQYGLCDQGLTSSFETVLGENLAEAKIKLKSRLSGDTLIKDYSFRYRVPNTLEVYCLTKKPKTALWNEQNKQGVVLDEQGLVLAKVEETNLPKLVSTGKLPNPGEITDQKTLFALDLVSDLHYFYQIKEGFLFSDYLEIIFSDNRKVLFPLSGDRQLLLGSLKLVLEAGKVSLIDLRFKNPILK